MPGNMTIPFTFQNQVGNVPASQLDDNWTAVRTYVNAREVTVGLIAARPAAGVSGRWFLATDVAGGTLYVDNGTSWTQAASGVLASGSGGVTLYLTPVSAAFENGDFPILSKNVGSQTWDYTLNYDSQTVQAARWELAVPANFAVTSANITVFSRHHTDQAGTVGWIFTHRAVASGSVWDASGTSVTIAAVAAPATEGTVLAQGASFTASSWTPQALLQLQLHRNVAGDSLGTSALFMGAVIRLT